MKLSRYKKTKRNRRKKTLKRRKLNMFGGSIIDNINNKNFIEWIKDRTARYFNNSDINYEEGGIITFNLENTKEPYELILTNQHDYDNMILYPAEMLENMKPNQIIWHTHNLERGFMHEPPSSSDLIILLQLALLNKFPIGIIIHKEGIWIYKINKELTQTQKRKPNFNGYLEFVDWAITAVDDIYSNPDPETINKYHPDDLTEHNIKKLETIQDYKNTINSIFDNSILIDFIPFETPI